MILFQLGRTQVIGYQVVIRCPYGWPAVIENDVFNAQGNPNPNLYYLTCPWLRRCLARLEDAGTISRLQLQLARDHAAAGAVREAQRAHSAMWLGRAEEKMGRQAGMLHMRIAQSADDLLLKCLHAHFAWYLVHPDYLLGQGLADIIGYMWCNDDRCAQAAGAGQDGVDEGAGAGT